MLNNFEKISFPLKKDWQKTKRQMDNKKKKKKERKKRKKKEKKKRKKEKRKLKTSPPISYKEPQNISSTLRLL